MNTIAKHHELEDKAKKMADGFRTLQEQGMQFAFRSGVMVPMQVAHRMQAISDHFQAIRDAEVARLNAEDALEKALPDHLSVLDEARGVVRAHFGSDPRRLAAFGMEEPRRVPTRRRAAKRLEREVVRTTIIERPGRSRVPEVEVIETEEMVETIGGTPRGDRMSGGRRRRARGSTASSAGTPLPGASPTPTVTAPPAAAPVAAKLKKKGGKA